MQVVTSQWVKMTVAGPQYPHLQLVRAHRVIAFYRAIAADAMVRTMASTTVASPPLALTEVIKASCLGVKHPAYTLED